MSADGEGSSVPSPLGETTLNFDKTSKNDKISINPQAHSEWVSPTSGSSASKVQNEEEFYSYYKNKIQEEERLKVSSKKHVSVLFEKLSVVRAQESNETERGFFYTLVNMFNVFRLFSGPYKYISNKYPKLKISKKIKKLDNNSNSILRNLTGYVKEGEMCLVIDRFGIWANALFETLTLDFRKVTRIEGNLELKGLSIKNNLNKLRNLVSYNRCSDFHLTWLDIEQSLDMALRFKPFENKKFTGSISKSRIRRKALDLYLQTLGLKELRKTIVGNGEIKGISGGQKRRLSITELLSAKHAIVCWEKVANGLDSTTALNVIRALRTSCDALSTTFFVSLSSGSERIYQNFDKVMVIDNGYMIYFGPSITAGNYFESLGYRRAPADSTIEFIVGILSQNILRVKPGTDSRSLQINSKSLHSAFERSSFFQDLEEQISLYKYKNRLADTANFMDVNSTIESKNLSTIFIPPRKLLRPEFALSPIKQVYILVCRNFYRTLELCKRNTIKPIRTLLLTSVIIGIIFFNTSRTLNSSFTISTYIFASLILPVIYAISYTTGTYNDIFVLEKHYRYGFYSPGALSVAHLITGTLNIAIGSSVYILISYMMSGLNTENGLPILIFYFGMVFSSSCALSIFILLSSFIRSSNYAIRLISVLTLFMATFSGYVIGQSIYTGLFKFLFIINPMQIAYTTSVYYQFRNLKKFICDEYNMVPNGPGYADDNYRVCSVKFLDNMDGLTILKFLFQIEEPIGVAVRYTSIILATVVFTFLTYFIARPPAHADSNNKLRNTNPTKIKRKESLDYDQIHRIHWDNSDQHVIKVLTEDNNVKMDDQTDIIDDLTETAGHSDNTGQNLLGNSLRNSDDSISIRNTIKELESGLVWSNVSYSINTFNGPNLLVNKFSGYAIPGKFVAIIGTSGAGKTTFLDVICSRRKEGISTGNVYLGGKNFSADSSERYVYCEQTNYLKETATVRETIRHSAYICRGGSIPKKYNDAYVDWLIKTFELTEYADTIIGRHGDARALSLSTRKIVSAVVDMTSNPSRLLIFDEPTAGMDICNSFEFIKTLRRFAKSGFIVLCVIHQPTANIFELFDEVILIAPGGRLIYNGSTGPNSSILRKYFEDNGAICNPNMNISDCVIDLVTSAKSAIEWENKWRLSEQNKKIMHDIKLYTEYYANKPKTRANLSTKKQFDNIKKRLFFRNRSNSNKILLKNELRVPENLSLYTYPDQLEKSAHIKRVNWFKMLMFCTIREWRELSRIPGYVTTRITAYILVAVSNSILIYFARTVFGDDDGFDGNGNITVKLVVLGFSTSILIFVAPSLIIRHSSELSLFEHEHRNKICSIYINGISLLLSEIPLALIGSTFYYLISGIRGVSEATPMRLYARAIALFLLQLYAITLGLAISSIVKSQIYGINVTSIITTLLLLTSGQFIFYRNLNYLVKNIIYHINPLKWYTTYLVLHEIDYKVANVYCDEINALTFKPAPNTTCVQYLRNYMSKNGGILLNPDNTELCMFCSEINEETYYSNYHVFMRDKKYKDILIFSGFIFFNILIYLLFSDVEYVKRKLKKILIGSPRTNVRI